MDFKNLPPDWEVQGTEPPEELRKTKGWLAGYKPPASYFNWFWNKCYLCLKELQEKLTGLETKHDTDVANTNAEVNKRLPLSGGTMTNTIQFNSAGSEIFAKPTADTGRLLLLGGTAWNNGGSIYACGKNRSNYAGGVVLRATDGTNNSELCLLPNGTATVGEKNIVRSVNGTNADVNGNITLDVAKSDHTHSYLPLAGGTMNGAIILNGSSVTVKNKFDNSTTTILGGTDWNKGAHLILCGNDEANVGRFSLVVADGETYNALKGELNGSLSWAGKNIVRSVNGINADASGNVTLDFDTIPVGTVIAYAGLFAPDGFLPCNGAEVSRTTYKALLDVIGTASGVGNGSTTFNLPNMNNGSFLEGSDSPCNYKSAGLPNITGTISTVAAESSNDSISGCFGNQRTTNWKIANEGSNDYAVDFNASWSNPIYGASDTVQPKSVTVKFCIKY